MAAADVGDDQFGEDPSINRLEERLAALLGKEAAMWVPTGTMANQVILRTLTRPGDDVIVAGGAHVALSETGAGSANAGVGFTQLPAPAGFFTADEFRTAVKPIGHIVLPPTTLVSVENTHNASGGRIVPLGVMAEVAETAAAMGVSSYMDGARLWNAAVATGYDPATLAAPFDMVWVAFSKGLGAPGGAIVAGPADTVGEARRYRRMQGGAMRQVGIFAAAADYALSHHLDDLALDHANARQIAEILADSGRIDLDPSIVETNIVYFDLVEGAPSARAVVDGAADSGVLALASGPRTIRVVTHRDVTSEQCRQAAATLVEVIDQ